MKKVLQILKQLGNSNVNLERVRFISTYVLAYSATAGGDFDEDTWAAQRDRTPMLSEFEKAAFARRRKIFMSATHTTATLDDDLYGTRATDNQVKTLRARKADREGHTADAIADAFFRLTLMVRFRRRGESQVRNVSKLIEALLENRSVQAMSGFILTADRGYGKLATLTALRGFGIHSILIIPDHLNRCHPFIGKSFLRPARNVEEEEGTRETGSGHPPDGAQQSEVVEESHNSGDNVVHPERLTKSDNNNSKTGAAVEPTTTAVSQDVELDRRQSFVIEDSALEGPASYFATKFVVVEDGDGTSNTLVTAVAVREHGTNKFSKILRFVYNVPSSLPNVIESWIAIPRSESMTHLLFCNRSDEGRIIRDTCEGEDDKYQTEFYLLQHCDVLTLSQRCAEWFILRQFRVTGNVAGNILMTSNVLRSLVGLAATDNEDHAPSILLQQLSKSWFSTSRSTEPMMKGAVNESPVMAAITRKEFVAASFECGMLAQKKRPWLACFQDGIALIDVQGVGFIDVYGEVGNLSAASIEIKTSVSDSALAQSPAVATSDVITCYFGAKSFTR